jgi:hypothetical protein
MVTMPGNSLVTAAMTNAETMDETRSSSMVKTILMYARRVVYDVSV